VLLALLGLSDTQQGPRSARLLTRFIEVVHANVQYPQATRACVRFLLQVVQSGSPYVAACLLDNRSWLKWLYYSSPKADIGTNVLFYFSLLFLFVFPLTPRLQPRHPSVH
jgi:hypothetical protein